MTLLHRAAATLLACAIMLPILPVRADTTYVIVRHGEKPAQGLGQLSCKGLNRALALPKVLLSRYGTPAAIYVPNPSAKKKDKGVPYAYIRPLATIEPLAIRAGLPVNTDWSMKDITPLVQSLLAQTGGTYVIAWEHHYAEQLARQLFAALGGDGTVPVWGDTDFDSIYVIRVRGAAQNVRHATFAREQEGLNGQPDTCDR
jgi:hypothetical protein